MSAGGDASTDAAVAPDLAAPALEVCAPDGKPLDITRRYGIRADLMVNVKIPGIYDKDAPAPLLLLADVNQQGGSYTITAAPCRSQIPPVTLMGQKMATVLAASDAIVQSVKPFTVIVKLDGPMTCAGLLSDPLAIVMGARLKDPIHDALPVFVAGKTALCGGVATTLCDAATDTGCICRQLAVDEDRLAAVVTATNVLGVDIDRVYLALRTVVVLDGKVFPPSAAQPHPGQRIKGLIDGLRLDQSPVGCRNSDQTPCDDATVGLVAKLNPSVTQSANTPSSFVAMPVPADETCVQLEAEAATLFRGQ